ncbi:MAG: hypothetical protein ABIQ16_00765 [Polyangiaceae bacterium]
MAFYWMARVPKKEVDGSTPIGRTEVGEDLPNMYAVGADYVTRLGVWTITNET